MCDSLTGHFDSAVRVKHKGQKVRDRMKRPGYEEGVWEDNRRIRILWCRDSQDRQC